MLHLQIVQSLVTYKVLQISIHLYNVEFDRQLNLNRRLIIY